MVFQSLKVAVLLLRAQILLEADRMNIRALTFILKAQLQALDHARTLSQALDALYLKCTRRDVPVMLVPP